MKTKECMDCSISIAERHHSSVRCESCQKENHKKLKKKNRIKHRETIKAAAREYRKKNNAKRTAYNKERYTSSYRRKRYLRDKEAESERYQRHKENITDLYIKDLLTGNRLKNKCPLRRKDIPPELIALKRKEVQIKRELDKIKERK